MSAYVLTNCLLKRLLAAGILASLTTVAFAQGKDVGRISQVADHATETAAKGTGRLLTHFGCGLLI